MTDPFPPSPGQPLPQQAHAGRENYAVGYARPPKETRFKPGQSGNQKGRPKRRQSIKTMLREVYTDRIAMHDGEKRCHVMRIIALLIKQWERGIKGNERAAQAAIAMAKELGVFDVPESSTASYSDTLSAEEIRLLSDQALKELIAIEKMRLSKLKQH